MNFIIEKASPSDFRLFADIIQSVWQHMEHQEWFAADDLEYIRHTLAPGRGIGYKAIEKSTKETAGVFLAAIPGLDESNMGYDIGLPKSALPQAVHMDSVAVLPQYRGNGLQYLLMQRAESDLKEQGFQYLLCTVHPENQYSRNNILRQGYRFVLQKKKYNGTIRDIMLKQL